MWIGGSNRIRTNKHNAGTILTVYNTGIGIAETDKEMVFERFYRADKARSRETNSYGLGLAIAKSIAEEHNGNITVDSEYGKWAKFSVELPVK